MLSQFGLKLNGKTVKLSLLEAVKVLSVLPGFWKCQAAVRGLQRSELELSPPCVIRASYHKFDAEFKSLSVRARGVTCACSRGLV